MRFMMIVKATKDSEADVMPSREMVAAMSRYNEELSKAGVLLTAEGLQASSKGARIRYSGDKRTVTDGPFTEAKELLAGFWLLNVKSKEEAIEWALRVPFTEEEVELRQVFDTSDFPADILPPEEAAFEDAMREKALGNSAQA